METYCQPVPNTGRIAKQSKDHEKSSAPHSRGPSVVNIYLTFPVTASDYKSLSTGDKVWPETECCWAMTQPYQI